MQSFMTPLHSGKDLVPLTFDIGAVGVKVKLESRRRENSLAQATSLETETPMPIGTTHKSAMTFIFLL